MYLFDSVEVQGQLFTDKVGKKAGIEWWKGFVHIESLAIIS